MKLATVQKYLLAFILMLLLVGQLSYVSAFAEEDPNKPVSDYFSTEEDNDTEKKELEPNTNEPTAFPSDVR